MKELSGIAASPGIMIGRAYVVFSEGFRVFPREIAEEDVEREIERFQEAIKESKKEILDLKMRFEERANEPGLSEIFDTHVHLLEDIVLTEETIRKVREERKNVEFVFSEILREIEEKFAAVDDEYLKQRWHDIQDVGGRILRKLLRRGKKSLSSLAEKVIVICRDLTPAETAGMDRENVLAFATDAGGRTSHTAIMAKALEIPAVVGLQNVTRHVRNDDVVIVDGIQGIVIVSPDEQTLNEYQIRRERYLDSERMLAEIKDLPAQTLDGHAITLCANIDMPDEVASVHAHGGQGIGLLRTEFLFLNRTTSPDEEEQAETYSRVAKLIAPNPVTIRSLDIGGDKLLGASLHFDEINPFMGCRAIRFCLKHLEIFKPQLRAILRASAHGRVRLIFPMITSLSEFRETKAILEESKQELRAKGIAFDENMSIGIMIETPAAVLIADTLAKEVDFFSIGSNDLIQYALAVDRVNERIADLYEPAHPGILRMLKLVVEAAERADVKLNVCGEIAADLPLVLLLIGLGIKELSMTPAAIPEVKKLIRSVSLKDIQGLANRALELSTSEEIRSEIQQTMMQLVPNFSGRKMLEWVRA